MPFSGARLRELRLRRALTLRDLGTRAQVSFDNIHAIETGKHVPRPSTVRKLAAALGVAPDVLFDDEPFDMGKAAA